jgi:hypothetical protein
MSTLSAPGQYSCKKWGEDADSTKQSLYNKNTPVQQNNHIYNCIKTLILYVKSDISFVKQK